MCNFDFQARIYIFFVYSKYFDMLFISFHSFRYQLWIFSIHFKIGEIFCFLKDTVLKDKDTHRNKKQYKNPQNNSLLCFLALQHVTATYFKIHFFKRGFTTEMMKTYWFRDIMMMWCLLNCPETRSSSFQITTCHWRKQEQLH